MRLFLDELNEAFPFHLDLSRFIFQRETKQEQPGGQNWNYRAARAASIASFLFHCCAVLWRRVSRAADNASLAVTAAAFLAARCRCCGRNYLPRRPCWIYLAWQQYLPDTTRRNALSFSRTCARLVFSFRRGKNSPGQPVCADVATSTATAQSRTPVHAQTPAQKCPGQNQLSTPQFPRSRCRCPCPCPFPVQVQAYPVQRPRPLTKARDFHY